MEKNHPGTFLLHVERASGSRQDLCVEGAGAVYWNRQYWVEFLDERLRNPGDNILQENLFVILTSCEMISLARVCSIIHLYIYLPTRWLAGNCHKLGNHNWSVRSMGIMVDILEQSLMTLENNGEYILDEVFMMGILQELYIKLPPFAEYLKHMYNDKVTTLVGDRKSKIVHLDKLRSELFSPTSETNKSTSEMTSKLGSIAAAALLCELRDDKKATAEHLSSAGGKFCWHDTSMEYHNDGLGKLAVNDPAESSFGGTTRQLQCFGRIGLTNAGGVDQVRRNKDFSRNIKTISKNSDTNRLGIFHNLSEEMRQSLLVLTREDSPAAREYDKYALARQRAEKSRKEELIKEQCKMIK